MFSAPEGIPMTAVFGELSPNHPKYGVRFKGDMNWCFSLNGRYVAVIVGKHGKITHKETCYSTWLLCFCLELSQGAWQADGMVSTL